MMVSEPKFMTPQIVATSGAANEFDSHQLNVALRKHFAGDWGEVDREDWASNDDALTRGGRLLSAYTFDGVRLWVITEADRSVTTLLLPSEY